MNKHIIKKYNLESSLSKISIILFSMIQSNSGIIERFNCHFGPFTFKKLTYLFINYSNDYRKLIINDKDLFILANQTFIDDLNSLPLQGNSIESINSFIFGISQEQFSSQELYQFTSYQKIRSFFIFNELFKKYSSDIDCNLIIKEKLGIDLKDYNPYIWAIFGVFSKFNILSELQFEKIFHPDFFSNTNLSKDKIKNIISYYTGSYFEYRTSLLKERLLLIKPIIKTDKNNLILIDPYSFLTKLGDGIYWIIRNYFFEKKSTVFIETFGLVYEDYIDKMLEKKIFFKNYQKLNPYAKKQPESLADWIISTDNFEIIIEQKSALASDKLKYGMPNISDIDNFIDKLKKAYQQLLSTEIKKLSNSTKTILKFILHYEYLPVKELIKDRIEETLNINSPELYIIISTSEFEILIDILSKNESLFNKILLEKIQLEKEKDYSKGTGFNQIFVKYGVQENHYIIELEKELSLKYSNFNI